MFMCRILQRPTGHRPEKKRDIDAEAFCRAYLQNSALTPEQTAFYRGYEAHLRTDVEWIRQILKPLKQKLGIAHFTRTPYDGLLRQNLTYLEQAFCRQAKSFPAWELAQQTKAFSNDVLPYYAEDTLTLKLQELRERYAEPVATAGTVFGYSGAAGCVLSGRRWSRLSACGRKSKKTNAPETGSNPIGKEEQA